MRVVVRVMRGNSPIEDKGSFLIVHTNERRENNRANLDVIKQVSKFYSLPSSKARLVSGGSSTRKVLNLERN